MIDNVVRALGRSDLQTQPVPVRIGGDLSRITIDLGPSASPLAVTAQSIAPAPDAVFARPKGSLDLPPPHVPETTAQAAEAVDALRRVLSIEPREWAACVAWLLAALRPEGSYPILYVRGEQGSGKSTLARCFLRTW
jgi:hypothetical protein